MKTKIKIIKIIDKMITTITILILVILMLFGIYALYDSYKVLDTAKLDEDIITLKPKENKINLDKLKEINEEIIGWIKIDNTHIDYPILQSSDNSKYLNTNYRGEYAISGSVFLDYRNNIITDDYSILYAHDMNNNLMFGEIRNYKIEKFFKDHLKGKLYIDNKKYDLEIIAYSMVDAYDDLVYDINYLKTNRNSEIVSHLISKVVYDNNLSTTDTSKLMLLSTCDASGVNVRSVLLVKLN